MFLDLRKSGPMRLEEFSGTRNHVHARHLRPQSLILARVGPLSMNLLPASRRKKSDQLYDSWCPQCKNKFKGSQMILMLKQHRNFRLIPCTENSVQCTQHSYFVARSFVRLSLVINTSAGIQ